MINFTKSLANQRDTKLEDNLIVRLSQLLTYESKIASHLYFSFPKYSHLIPFSNLPSKLAAIYTYTGTGVIRMSLLSFAVEYLHHCVLLDNYFILQLRSFSLIQCLGRRARNRMRRKLRSKVRQPASHSTLISLVKMKSSQ